MSCQTGLDMEEARKLQKLLHVLQMVTHEVVRDDQFDLDDVTKLLAAEDVLFVRWLRYLNSTTGGIEVSFMYSVPELITPKIDNKEL